MGLDIVVSTIENEGSVSARQNQSARALTTNIISIFKNGNLLPQEKIQFLCEIALGGLIECDEDTEDVSESFERQLAILFNVYLNLQPCSAPEHFVLKHLHLLRDNITDMYASEKAKEPTDVLMEYYNPWDFKR